MNVLLLLLLLTGLAEAQVGPQPSIACPQGAVLVQPGQPIPTTPGTSVCLAAGEHRPTAPINAGTGQSFTGQFGAIVDGSNVTLGFDPNSTGIFRGWNCGACAGVTIRNLVIRNRANYNCIGTYGPNSGAWTIDHNEIHGCRWGVSVSGSAGTQVTFNYIHHNTGPGPLESGGYGSYLVSDMLFEGNEFAYNGREQKITVTRNVIFRSNFVHHNGNGIWYDADNTGVLIEGNRVEDESEQGIFYEKSGQGVIRNNIIRRSGENGLFMSTSRDVEIYGNTFEDNASAILYFLDCGNINPPDSPYVGALGWDLRNNLARDNTVRLQAGATGNWLSYTGCSQAQLQPYASGGVKNLKFERNSYGVPNVASSYWQWGDVRRSWAQWQQSGQDVAGVLLTGGVPTPKTSAPLNVRIQ